jgi:hypothetical protein
MCAVIGKEGLVGALAVGAHRLGVLVELPLVSLQAADGLGDVVKVWSATRLDLFRRQFVDEVEGGDVDALRVGFRTKRADAGRHIKDGLAAQRDGIESEEADVFIERATEQNDFVEDEALFVHSKRRKTATKRRSLERMTLYRLLRRWTM